MVRTRLEDVACPACGQHGMEYHAEHVDLPFLGESLETMLRCPPCGFRHTDFVLTAQREPIRYTYRITAASDMMVRVVRSSSGTVRIPELGILIEPGIASEAFISNIEGVLVRVERVLDQLHRDAEDAVQTRRIEALLDTLKRMRDGTAPPATLVLEDPHGNSAILHEDAERQAIPAEEAERLKTGMAVIERNGPEGSGGA